MPDRLKFCNSRGPTLSAGVLLLEDGVPSCAGAAAGASKSPAVKTAMLKRLAPLICSRPKFVNRADFPRRDRHMPAERVLFKHCPDEPDRNSRH